MTPAPAASPVRVYNEPINEINSNEMTDRDTADTTMQQSIYNSIIHDSISGQVSSQTNKTARPSGGRACSSGSRVGGTWWACWR